MSGHSKWDNIKHRKGAQDAVRSKIFMKLSKELMVAASGPAGANPETNAALKLVIAKAKSQSMPKANIEKAIAKAAGTSKDGHNFKEYIYSGTFTGGVTFLVTLLTDNINRAISNLQALFSKNGGQIGKSGVVPYNFELKGIIEILKEETKISTDELMLNVIEYGAEDFIENDESYTIKTTPSNFSIVKDNIEKNLNINNFEMVEVLYLANNLVSFDEDKLLKFSKLLDLFEDDEDIQNVYHNVDFSLLDK